MPPAVSPTVRSRLFATASNAHTAVSVLGLAVAGLLYLVIPGALGAAAVGVLSPGIAPAWAAAMFASGVVAFAGIAWRLPLAEISGLGVLGAAVCLAAVSVLDVRQVEVAPVAVIYLSSGLSCVARIGALVHLKRQADRVQAIARSIAEGS